eukprot:8432238-Pyramimonas_sp.AAC.1
MLNPSTRPLGIIWQEASSPLTVLHTPRPRPSCGTPRARSICDGHGLDARNEYGKNGYNAQQQMLSQTDSGR